jgi:hypothetical protein
MSVGFTQSGHRLPTGLLPERKAPIEAARVFRQKGVSGLEMGVMEAKKGEESNRSR